MNIIELEDMTVRYDDSQEIKDAVFEAVINFYKKHETFDSESICQSDDPIIDGHCCLAEIADNIIKFDVDCNG